MISVHKQENLQAATDEKAQFGESANFAVLIKLNEISPAPARRKTSSHKN